MVDIIYFGNDWDTENKTSSHHIAERLSKENRLLYIDCPGLRPPKAKGRDIKKLFLKLWRSISGTKKITDNLYHYSLLQIPFHKYKFIKSVNDYLVLFTIRVLKYKLKFDNPILWFVVPHVYMVPSNISNICSVYYCIDDYAGMPGVDAKAVEMMDSQMSRNCDIIFVASETLLERKKKINRNVYLSPHGVDFDHFNSANQISEDKIPEEIRKISQPIIGFFGLIDERIDLDLIKLLATWRPEWNFVFIGRLDYPSNPCLGLPNVHFLGKKLYAELPFYAARFSIGIMPYKPNHRMNIHCNPLKLREYLSIGLPVVSAPLHEVMSFKSVVSIANSPEEYLSAIEKLLMEKHPIEEKLNRQSMVRDATWDARFSEVFSIVKEHIASKTK